MKLSRAFRNEPRSFSFICIGLLKTFVPLLLLFVVMCASPTSLNQNTYYAEPTLKLVEVDGELIPVQNGVVYPSFVPQPQIRVYQSLNGDWFIYYDKDGDTLRMNDLRISLARRDRDVVEILTKDMIEKVQRSGWIRVSIPSSNNARGGFMEGYQGVAWYRRNFTIPVNFIEHRRLFLVFHGVNYIADVWINGVYVGYHEGGFTPFIFDVTKFLRIGDNEIVVRVDNIPWNSRDAAEATIMPYKRADWWNYGGIYRDIYLEIVNNSYIARVDFAPERIEWGIWRARVRVVIDSVEEHNALVRICLYRAKFLNETITRWEVYPSIDFSQPILCKDVETHIRSGITVVKEVFDRLRVSEWSPENPSLYVIFVELYIDRKLVDSYADQVGFREVRVLNEYILLNGEKLFIKGVSRHEDYPKLGRALTYNIIFSDLTIVKNIGANFLRTAHYPNHPLTYIYTDRLGLLVWEEIPVYWFDCWAFGRTIDRGIAQQTLLEMIFRDFNRPSIIIWSLANECACREERIYYLKTMRDLVKAIDSTRLVTQAIAWDPGDDTSIRAQLDLLAVNMYFGVFYGKLEDLDIALKELRRRYPGIPIIISEFGYWSGGGVGEVRQAEYFKKAWSIIVNNTGIVSGAIWWTIFDYDSMIVFDTFGALDWTRTYKKLLYNAIEKAYKESPNYFNLEATPTTSQAAYAFSILPLVLLIITIAIAIVTAFLIRKRR